MALTKRHEDPKLDMHPQSRSTCLNSFSRFQTDPIRRRFTLSTVWPGKTAAFDDGTHFWSVQTSNSFGSGAWSETWVFSESVFVSTEDGADVPERFALHQNYPNPFNPTTTVEYDVSVAGKVTVAMFDVLGRPIRVLVDGQVAAGRHKVTIDAGDLPSGTYLLRMLTDNGVFGRTITLLK